MPIRKASHPQSPSKASSTFPRPAVTVDVIPWSIRQGQLGIWLIQRRSPPYAKRWALPGGFVNQDEPLVDAARRELLEETQITLARRELTELGAFGDPGRDPRGWTISIVFHAWLDEAKVQPKAGDDAQRVKWFPLRKLPKLAFDHEHILEVGWDSLKRHFPTIYGRSSHRPKAIRFKELTETLEAIHGKKLDVKALTKTWLREGVLLKSTHRKGKNRFRFVKHHS